VDVRKLIAIRDEFAERYRKPEQRFVSLGFAEKNGKPILTVFVDHNYPRWGLPDEFHGIAVEARYSSPAKLAVGPVL
jgi:hypothetical protein